MPNGTMPPCIDVAKLPPLITTETTAAILSCSKSQVRRMCTTGQIKASKVGVDWRINTRALLAKYGLEG